MGNVFSSAAARQRIAEHVTSESVTLSNVSDYHDMEAEEAEQFHDTIDEDVNDDEARARAKEEEMVEFRRQLDIKREQRKQILARHRSEKEELEKSLENERKSKLELYESNKQLRELLTMNNIDIPEQLNSNKENLELSNTIVQMKEEFENLKSNNNKLRKDLAESNNTLQSAFSDIAELNAQNIESMKHINALKEVVSVSKTMINLREQQLTELKNKLSDIEKSLADRETSMLSTDLRQEYERQLLNIRTLRGLYEERARLSEVTRLGLVREVEEQKSLYQAENNKCKNLTAKVEELEATVDSLHEKIENKNNQISTYQNETSGLQAEMAVVNKLFSQVLLGYKNKQDLDKLVHRLEENHGLLTHMAEKENGSEASTALPKLLLEIVSQVDENEGADHEHAVSAKEEERVDKEENASTEEIEVTYSSHTTPEEIVENLPKVWRVLMELLSHQNVTETNPAEKVTTCYKSVETKSGPVLVPSVSQTYIRLKDLIIEKLGLIKEVNRMKQLNVHLETRLEEQERRLCLVTSELSKTWNVVGRLRRHHHQLHTHEKILKYELQQKRKMLNELKEELAYCREKWIQAREKNTQSEKDWRKLRAEFSSRNTKAGSPSCNNSAESGYSDERPSDDSSESNDESEYIAEPLMRCKKKNKKSFETILDSSNDINLVAEREDPSSDMLDVADLPLDTQDESHSEGILKSDVICDETEDEIGEITNESYIDGNSLTGINENNDICSYSGDNSQREDPEIISETPSTSSNTEDSKKTLIDPVEILKNIKLQNERLAKKEEKLERLEKCSAALLTKTQNTVKFSEQINSTLDHLIGRPTSVEQASKNNCKKEVESEIGNGSNELQKSETDITETPVSVHVENLPETDSSIHSLIAQDDHTQNSASLDLYEEASKNSDSENESASSSSYHVTADLGNILQKRNSTEDALDTEISEPSTSNEIDHEARFAARDLRLKRLEEQTKSLVNKVNKTTTKGVKIHYKLEELHNIYGSENSRAGTPSEDTEDKSQKDDDSHEE